MCLKFIKGKAKKSLAFALAMMMAGMVATPAYAETTKGFFGKEVKITHETKENYVANATFYDYYSDSQVGTTSTPNAITDALKSSKNNVNTFQLFNNVLLKTMKYGDATQAPTKDPLYQGYFALGMTKAQTGNIYSTYDMPGGDVINKASNFDLDNHGGWTKLTVTEGLVNNKLTTDSNGITYVTTTNPDNGKTAKLPYFDKDLLTSTTFENSELTIGSVKEKVAFPFRKNDKDGVTYYEFDSSKDVVRFNNEGDLVYKGTKASEQVKDVNGLPGFFPYNTPADSNSEKLNFGFGTKIEIPFGVTSDGKINKKDITFEFTGDDDVWVFVDGELAIDIGGGHKAIKASMNLADLKRTVNGVTTQLPNAVKSMLRDTSKTHTLTLFYLERGEWQSNMKMSFNLPEPNNITVANEIKTSDVNKTFLEAVQAIVANEQFVVGLTDKNLNEFDEQVLTNKEYVSYTDEFKYNDTLQLKLTGLKDTTRNLEDLYNTTYTLSDAKGVISSKKNTQVSDSRAKTNDAFLFRNLNNTSTPFLLAAYVNQVATGKLEIVNSVSSIKNENDEFEYIVTYCNVFGKESEAKFYSGEYTLEKADGKKETKTTADGKIVLKANEKVIIEGIPTCTKVGVQNTNRLEAYKLEGIDKTANFTADEKEALAVGEITKKNNEVIFALKAEGGKKVDPKAMDKTPSTGDTFNSLYVILIMAAAAIMATSVTIVIRKKASNR